MSRKKIKTTQKNASVGAEFPVTLVDQTTGEKKQFTVGELLETIMQLKSMNEALVSTVDGAFNEFDARLKALETKETT